jgi:hypothetical protein
VIPLSVDDAMDANAVIDGTGDVEPAEAAFILDLRGVLDLTEDLDVSDGSDLFRVIARS